MNEHYRVSFPLPHPLQNSKHNAQATNIFSSPSSHCLLAYQRMPGFYNSLLDYISSLPIRRVEHNTPCILPLPGYLEHIAVLAARHSSLATTRGVRGVTHKVWSALTRTSTRHQAHKYRIGQKVTVRWNQGRPSVLRY